MNSITGSFYPGKIKSPYNTMKYSQMQWVMSKLLHLRDCGSIPLSANQDTNHGTKLPLLGRKEGRKETQKRKNNFKNPQPKRKKERKKQLPFKLKLCKARMQKLVTTLELTACLRSVRRFQTLP